MKTLFILSPAVFLLASCASNSSSGSSSEVSTPTLSQRINGAQRYSYSNGELGGAGSKRSEFESKGELSEATSDYAKKEYASGDFKKKAFWGNKDYSLKSYDGNTDGSQFAKASNFANKSADEGSKNVVQEAFATNDYGTNAANEASAKNLDKPSDAETDFRRKVYGKPKVVNWDEQRDMSVEETTGMIGRLKNQ
ncbi:hypothetical protein JIN85_01295 [Luteolibacter pohnpeiensis]|uniref:Lipoprotein n=1 Tax=Luteolibacter pohnpeiensis TaxID=454153 RepID=A0A934S2A7_9BACT|nr:hypothetical protein [Luteolibacter pohnpeiensis]MBK1881027.1 hypothetical protein [Luteolibacter pohnpeiensis]